MVLLILGAAFLLGALAVRIGLPPLVGYLIAGFLLSSLGVEQEPLLKDIADIGITLLLFTIGLKLNPGRLAKSEILAGAPVHMLATVIVFGAAIAWMGKNGTGDMAPMGWTSALLVAFALSFSSTVFAVKMFEDKHEIGSRHADTAIGILIVQDIVAVVFLALTSGAYPSIWTLVLMGGLFAARPLLFRLMAVCDHGELLVLFGMLLAVAGYGAFEWVGLKGDLGALVVGMLVAAHPKASELGETLFGFKNLFLTAFFLNIGLLGFPTLGGLSLALVLTLAMPLKSILFYILLTVFRLPPRTAMLTSLGLANYSEFGLIVGSVCVSKGWIESQWLVILAVALSLSFVVAAPANTFSSAIHARWSSRLNRNRKKSEVSEMEPIVDGSVKIAVIGMAGIGTAAYDQIRRTYGPVVMGIDFCTDVVEDHRKKGRNVVYGDADDSGFWERIMLSRSNVELVMIALPDVKTIVFAVGQMRGKGYRGRIIASLHYQDEIDRLKKVGLDVGFLVYEEAGVGFADHASRYLDLPLSRSPDTPRPNGERL
jgi:predicted Kef-type K+ transport protein